MRSPEQAAREEKPVVGTEQETESVQNKEGSGVRERPRSAEENVQEFLRNSSSYGLKAKMLAEELTELQRKTLVTGRDTKTGKPLGSVKVMTADAIANYRNDLTQLDQWLADMNAYAANIEGHLTPHQREQVKYTVGQNEAIRERIAEALETSKSRKRIRSEEPEEEPKEAAFVSNEEPSAQKERVSKWASPKEKAKPKGVWGRIKSWFK